MIDVIQVELSVITIRIIRLFDNLSGSTALPPNKALRLFLDRIGNRNRAYGQQTRDGLSMDDNYRRREEE